MSGHTLFPIEAEALLALIRSNIVESEQNSQAVAFCTAQDEAGITAARPAEASTISTLESERVRKTEPEPPISFLSGLHRSELAFQAEADNFGTPPPTPNTIRGRIGKHLFRFVERILWWQTAQWRQLLGALRDYLSFQTTAISELAYKQAGFESAVFDLRRESAIQQRTMEATEERCSVLQAMHEGDKAEIRQLKSILAHQLDLQQRNIKDLDAKIGALEELLRSYCQGPQISSLQSTLTIHSERLVTLEEVTAESTAALETAAAELRAGLFREVKAREYTDGLLRSLEARTSEALRQHSEENVLSPQRSESSLNWQRLVGLESAVGFHSVRLQQVQDAVTELASDLSSLAQATATDPNLIRTLADGLSAEAHAREHTDELLRSSEASLAEALRQLLELGTFARQSRAELSIQRIQLARLEHTAQGAAEEEILPAHGADDAFYVALEDRFRGSRSEIKTRQSIYITILRQADLGSAEAPVLDLGCGRGEWLELLRENGKVGRGVDENRLMIDMCESLGLSAVHDNALRHLTGTPDGSLGALTAFHLIEHLPFEHLNTLLDNAVRTLKKGGLLILETPNPRNVTVGAFSFYLDPTHVRPVPSQLLWFLLESRGFYNLRLLELNPPPQDSQASDCLTAPLDYAVIGERP